MEEDCINLLAIGKLTHMDPDTLKIVNMKKYGSHHSRKINIDY